MAVLDNVSFSPEEVAIRGRVDLLGRAEEECSTYTTTLLAAGDGLIYGATMANDGPGGKALLFRYDPSRAWTSERYGPAANPAILGEPFPQDAYGWEVSASRWIWDLVEEDGKIYGGFYYWSDHHADECRARGGRVFVYDPALPWSPGEGVGSNPRDLGQAVAGEAGVMGLCVGNDGWIYGGTISSAISYKQTPPEGRGGHIFRLDPATVGRERPHFEDLGKVAVDVYEVWSLTAHPSRDLVYAGTAEGARVYEIDASSMPMSATPLGSLEAAAYGYVSEMITASDGRIYVGTYPTCRLGVYDPSDAARGLVDMGTVHESQRELPGLAEGPDGCLYLGTYGHARMGNALAGETDYYDGCLLRLDLSSVDMAAATVELENLGTAAGELGGKPFTPVYWIDTLCAGSDGRIYGAGNNNFMFRFDPAHPYDARGSAVSVAVYPSAAVLRQVIPRPNTVNATRYITGLARASDGRIYGCTAVDWWGRPEHSLEQGGRLFWYRPAEELGAGEYRDLGQALPTEYALWSPVEGPDGAVYFGTQPGGRLARYKPDGGGFEDLGTPREGISKVTALCRRGELIIGGTDKGAHLFRYHPHGGAMLYLGSPVPGSTSIDALMAGREGLVYGTIGPVFFTYDPERPWSPGTGEGSNPRNRVIPDYPTRVSGLAQGRDGRVYLGAYPTGAVYVFDPASGEIARDRDGNNRGIYALAAGSDGKIYGGAQCSDMYAKDHELLARYEDGSYVSMPWVCGWENAVTALVCGSNGRIYGGTGNNGYLFEYEPGFVFEWEKADYRVEEPAGTGVAVDVLDLSRNLLLEDVGHEEDISGLSPEYPAVRLRARMSSGDDGVRPSLKGWSLSWVPGRGPAPHIASLVEEGGDGAVYCCEEVELVGSGFGAEKGSSAAWFADTRAEEVISWSDTSIRLRVPAGCSEGEVRVVTMAGESNGVPYTLTDGPLHHFDLSPVASPQRAGVPFTVTVTARDACGNPIPFYTGPAGLSSTAGALIPASTGTFSGGSWTGQVTVVGTGEGVRIRAVDGAAAGESNPFRVDPGPLHHFDLSPVASPQRAGVPFTVTVTARDACGNPIPFYTGPAGLSSTAGALIPASTGTFSGGSWTGQVTVVGTGEGVRIRAVDGAAAGESNPFRVDPGPAPVPSTSLFFAEGYTGEGFEEWLCLANPGEEKATARVELLGESGSLGTAQVEIPPRSRRTLNINQLAGAGRDVSLLVTSDLPVAAERPMYFNYRGVWTGGHVGAPLTPSTSLFFAEGYTGEGFEEW
ncbi:MAG: DUF5719 family protein, partial [Actinomycetota bacterium]|nr:DUF5719 family protein [Actinomycetota bacterium]